MKGNDSRLYDICRRAERGEDITIGFLGGSITQGSLSSKPETCYAYLVYDWFVKRFPKAKVHYVNAGIGGTTSYFGVARMGEDLMMYRPDFVVIDFSVNDDAEAFFEETYEGVIRRLMFADFEPAVLALNNVFYDTGVSAEEFHSRVTDAYGIGHVNIKNTLYRRISSREMQREEISPDGLHPNDKGHALIAGDVTDYIADWMDRVEKNGDKVEEINVCAVTPNRFEATVRYDISNTGDTNGRMTVQTDGFTVDTAEKKGHLDLWKRGWIGQKEGNRISFTFYGRTLGIQYRKSVRKPVPIAQCIVDDDTTNPLELDGNFTEDWGDCLYLQSVLVEDVPKLHTVTIEIKKAENTVEDFYLNSLLIS